jgi:hypothetical protein
LLYRLSYTGLTTFCEPSLAQHHCFSKPQSGHPLVGARPGKNSLDARLFRCRPIELDLLAGSQG